MDGYGTLTDYNTGEAIRPASAPEWRETAWKLASGDSDAYTGAFRDHDGRAVYVDGGPDPEVTDADIAVLEQEAASAGDGKMVRLCRAALRRAVTVPAGAFEDSAKYRVAGICAGMDEVFDPDRMLAANGLEPARDGDDLIVSGAALNMLAATCTPDDDGYIEDGQVWAAGDSFGISFDSPDADDARAQCVAVILAARMEAA